jgi:hypothetical protein
MSKVGGKRDGAGRPKGATTRPRFSVIEHFTSEEVKDFFDDLMKRAKTDSKIAIYLAEQITGKAPQAMSIDMGGDITITFDSAFKK